MQSIVNRPCTQARVSLRAEIDAVQVFEREAIAAHDAGRLVALERIERELWDGLGNLAALR